MHAGLRQGEGSESCSSVTLRPDGRLTVSAVYITGVENVRQTDGGVCRALCLWEEDESLSGPRQERELSWPGSKFWLRMHWLLQSLERSVHVWTMAAKQQTAWTPSFI